jgi:uncharacterized membrane protein YphA (DoxX/SURF4 family)
MLSKHVTSWTDRWKAYWFSESTGVQLAVCRIIVVASQLLFFFPSLDSQLMLLRPFRGFIEPQILMVAISKFLPSAVFPTASVFMAIYWATAAAGITTLIGLFTRTSAIFFALGNWILVAHLYSYGEDHHPEAILCIFLMLLALSPAGRRLSVDALIRRSRREWRHDLEHSAPENISTALWPIKLTQVLLAFAYLSTGLAKLAFGGLAWMNGYTLQQIIFSSAIARDIPIGVWLAQQHALCQFLSVGVILFEVFFFVALIIPKMAPYFLLGGVLMHLGIYFAEGSDFFQYIILYVVFIDFEKWFAKAKNFLPGIELETSRRATQSY